MCVSSTPDNKSKTNSTLSLVEKENDQETESSNRTERIRRLIPYMTYYIPTTNDFESVRTPQQQQNYNYMLIKQPTYTNDDQYFEDNIKPSQPTAAVNHHQSDYRNYRYQPLYTNQNQRPAILYNTAQQGTKYVVEPAAPQPQFQSVQLPQKSQQQSTKKNPHTPFLPTNKIPGGFRPMYFQKDENLYQYDVKVPRVTLRPIDLQEIRSTPRLANIFFQKPK